MQRRTITRISEIALIIGLALLCSGQAWGLWLFLVGAGWVAHEYRS